LIIEVPALVEYSIALACSGVIVTTFSPNPARALPYLNLPSNAAY